MKTNHRHEPTHVSGRSLASRLALVLLVLAASTGVAGASVLPPSFQKSAVPLTDVANELMLPVDVASYRAVDRSQELALVPGPIRYAADLEVSLDVMQLSTWEVLDDGSRLGRLRISSPGALSLNLGFSRFELPEAARLWVYDARGEHVAGPYTRLNRTVQGQFWTPIVLDAEIVVEVQLPAGAAGAAVEVGWVNHGYRFFGEAPNKQGSCNIDVVCPQANPYRDQIRSVARYTIGPFLCTGQLVNNTAGDFRPFFLTAEHCGVNASNAGSMVVYWNYESPSCGQLSGGSLADNQSGASFRASYIPTDMTLVELNQMPATSSNVYYAGWDARAPSTPSQSVVGIHHPRGDEKAIAFEGDAVVSVDIGEGGETHWQVTAWDEGTTEGGSSGSCIFDQTTKACIGTLTGGFASCENPTGFDVYGKLSLGWNGGGTNNSRLSTWLDPMNGGNTRFLAGADPTTIGGGGEDECVPDSDTLCLNGDRFKIEIAWDTGAGTGAGQVVPGGTNDSNNIWFFEANNWELLIKVLDGCAINDHFWVFFAATTDVGFTVEVTDTSNGQIQRYTNPLGQAANAVTDTAAFATCN